MIKNTSIFEAETGELKVLSELEISHSETIKNEPRKESLADAQRNAIAANIEFIEGKVFGKARTAVAILGSMVRDDVDIKADSAERIFEQIRTIRREMKLT